MPPKTGWDRAQRRNEGEVNFIRQRRVFKQWKRTKRQATGSARTDKTWYLIWEAADRCLLKSSLNFSRLLLSQRDAWRHWAIMLSGDVTSRKWWVAVLIYSPIANNLNNFITKLCAITEGGRRNWRANASRVKAVSGVCSTFGVQNLNPQQEI